MDVNDFVCRALISLTSGLRNSTKLVGYPRDTRSAVATNYMSAEGGEDIWVAVMMEWERREDAEMRET